MEKLAFSFAGGGIRGIIPAYIFNYMEQRLGKPLPIDFIGGTSTGSILGGALAAGIPAENILNFYLEDGPYIFGKNKFSYNLKTVKGLFGGKYDSARLEEKLEKRLGNVTLGDLKTPFLCTAYNMSIGDPVIFNTIEHPKLLLKDVVVASSSAPTYFNPKKINGDEYIDGGVFCSNPSIATFTKVKEYYGITAKDLFMVFMGTGNREKEYYKIDRWFKYKWIKPLIDLMMSSDAQFTNDMLYSLYSSIKKPSNFIEINYDLPECLKGDMADASPRNINNLLKFSKYYIKCHETYLDYIIKYIRNLEN